MELLIQVLAEIGLQLLFEATVDGLTGRMKIDRSVGRFLLLTGLGVFSGLMSLLAFPQHFISRPLLRYGSLGLTPLLIGWLMAQIGRWRETRGRERSPLERFWAGWGFAFAFGLMRVTFAR